MANLSHGTAGGSSRQSPLEEKEEEGENEEQEVVVHTIFFR